MRFVDSNVFLRYLTRDDPTAQAACAALFARIEHGDEQVVTSAVHIHETAYVLTSPRLYNLSHADAAARLRPLLQLRALRLPQKNVCMRALDLFAAHAALDYADALAIAEMHASGLDGIYSFDADFDRFPDTPRLLPS